MTPSLPLHSIPWLPIIVREYLQHYQPGDVSSVCDQIDRYPFSRQRLVEVLNRQYQRTASDLLKRFPRIQDNIKRLADPKSLVVVGGQQIHLWGGPLYVAAKAVSIIKAAESLEHQLRRPVIPIFWMHTEDHDYTEIRCVQYGGRSYCAPYEPTVPHPTGNLPAMVGTELMQQFPESVRNTFPFFDQFQRSYEGVSVLSDATRRWITELWGEHGLVVLDPADAQLKQMAASLFQLEFEEQLLSRTVNHFLRREGSRWQRKAIPPRPINAFWIDPRQGRLRIHSGNSTLTAEGIPLPDRPWEAYSDRISPNVLLRPLFQQAILPAVVVILGPSEITYWLQLRLSFKESRLVYPLLVPRTWLAAIPSSLWQWWEETRLPISWLFEPLHVLEAHYLNYHAQPILDLHHQIEDVLASKELEVLNILKGQEGPYWQFRKSVRKAGDKFRQRVRKVLRQRLSRQLDYLTSLQDHIGRKGKFQDRVRYLVECGTDLPTDLIHRYYHRVVPLKGTLEILPY